MKPKWRKWCAQLGVVGFWWAGGALATVVGCGDSAIAQITPDNTLGKENSVVTPNVEINGSNSDRIDGGATRGANLFHSFREFNIDEGRGAYFSNPTGIENILSRVTGEDPSQIKGTLGVLGGNANLFLINPHGIIFGHNSRLDVGGSFVGTTANAIAFGEQGFFSASDPSSPPLLTVNPSAFLFNQIRAAPITSQAIAPAGTDPSGSIPVSGLRVPDGRSLLLLGGNVSIDSSGLLAFGGRVDLGGVAGTGTVGLNLSDGNLSLSFPENIPRADLSLTNGAGVIVFAGVGGSIGINARNVDLQGSVLSAGIGQGLGSVGSLAGDIALNATGTVTVANSFIFNSVSPDGLGNAGNVTIEAGRLSVTDGSQVATSTFGAGNAGNLTVRADESVELSGEIPGTDGQTGVPGGLFAQVNTTGAGRGGNLTIETGRLSVSDGSQVQVATFGNGDAGDLLIRAADVNIFETPEPNDFIPGIFAGVQRDPRTAITPRGNAGNLTIETERLSIQNGGGVSTDTLGEGNGGNLIVQAQDSVEVVGTTTEFGRLRQSFLTANVGPGATGKGGDLTIETGRLRVSNSQLTASTFGEGDAGNLTVRANESVELSGELPNIGGQTGPGGLFAQVAPTGMGRGGNLTIETGRLSISDGSQVQVATLGNGDAGDLLIRAADVNVFETPLPNFFTTGIFASVQTARDPRSAIAPRGNGGNLTIETGRLSVRDGGQVSSATFGEGNAGNLIIRAQDSVEVFGTTTEFGRFRPSLLAANVNQGATGQGGSLRIETGHLDVRSQAEVTVSSEGSGNAGDLEIVARSTRLDNQGKLRAETTSGNGGNIKLQDSDLLLMRNNSEISTTAGTEGAGGNGGDITIDTDLLVAVPEENSDISANAFEGRGGNIRINTQGIFNAHPRGQNTPFSDITASSELGIDGTVTINTPDVDPSQGLVQLPAEIADASNQIAAGCAAPGGSASSKQFTITGRGGLPPNPKELLGGEAVLTNWATLGGSGERGAGSREDSDAHSPTEDKGARRPRPNLLLPTSHSPAQIVEAQGWIIGSNGEVILTATTPTVTPYSPALTRTNCHD